MKPNISLPLFSILMILISMLSLVLGTYITYGSFGFGNSESQSYFNCKTNECAVNMNDGSKRCPTTSKPLLYDPSIEICSDKLSCSNSLMPYALNSDGSVNLDGKCDGFACPCTTSSSCAYYISATFTTSNGNIYQPLSGQRLTFPQNLPNTNASGGQGPTFPLISNINNEFCEVSQSWLSLAQPGCNFVSLTDISYQDVVQCMNLVNTTSSNTNGFVYSPCSQGTLAFITDDSSTITSVADTEFLLVGCVNATPCSSITAGLFYDKKIGGTVCLNLNN